MINHRHCRMDRTRFWIVGAIHQPPQAGMHRRPCTHRAGLNCSKQFAAAKAVVTNVPPGFAQGYELGMGSRIVLEDAAIPTASDDLAITHDYGADWHFSGFKRSLSAAEGLFHPELVGGGGCIGKFF